MGSLVARLGFVAERWQYAPQRERPAPAQPAELKLAYRHYL
jgi:hypothetical protein